MSDTGKYIIEEYTRGAKTLWPRVLDVAVPEKPFDENRLRRDMAAVESQVSEYFPKADEPEKLRAFEKGAAAEAGFRGIAASMLHKRHQLGRTRKLMAAMNSALGLFDTSGRVANLQGGLPE